MTDTNIHCDDDSKFPSHAWPGGYPIIYYTADGGILCPRCTNGENGSEASVRLDAPPDWRIVGADIYWEGPPLQCDHCNAEIESAYGNPGSEEE